MPRTSGTRDSAPSLRKRRGTYHHGNLRRALIAATLDLIQKEGVADLSLRAVARRAGVSSAAPYRHFPSREALLAAVAEEGFRLLGNELRRTIAEHGDDPGRRLGECGVTYVRFAAEHPSRYHAMFTPELADRRAHPSLRAAEEDTRRLLLSAVREVQEAGRMDSGAADELALSAWSSVHGLASLITSGYVRPERVEDVARSVARWVVPGFQG